MNAPVADTPVVELRTWRQFLATAELLHFGRAARRLGMTQPPLTQAIQKLEQQLETRLFDRSRRKVALTPAGAALVAPVRQLLQEASMLQQVARDAARGHAGTLRLGFVSTVAFGPLPGWLRGFRAARPTVSIRLREATTDAQLAAFAEGELDAGFILHAPGHVPDSPVPLQRISVGVEPLVLALPEQPAARKPRSLVPFWRSQPLVIFPRTSAPSLYDAVLAFYHEQGLCPNIAQEAVQMQTIVNLVSAGLGVALVPRVVSLLQRPGVLYRELPTRLARTAPRVETSLVWADDAPNVVDPFVEFVRRTSR